MTLFFTYTKYTIGQTAAESEYTAIPPTTSTLYVQHYTVNLCVTNLTARAHLSNFTCQNLLSAWLANTFPHIVLCMVATMPLRFEIFKFVLSSLYNP